MTAANEPERRADLAVLLAWGFGDRLRKIRRSFTDDSQPVFAERLGVGVKAYSAWEAGTNEPPSKKLLALARRIELLTGVPAAWVLGVDEPPRVAVDTPHLITGPNAQKVADLARHLRVVA